MKCSSSILSLFFVLTLATSQAFAAHPTLPDLAPPAHEAPSGGAPADAVGSSLHKQIPAKNNAKYNSSKNVTRYELAVILDNFDTYTENGFKPARKTQSPSVAVKPAAKTAIKPISGRGPAPDVAANHPAAVSVGAILKKGIMMKNAKGQFDGAKLVTRAELAIDLDKYVAYIETTFKPLHKMSFPVATRSLTAPLSSDVQAALIELQSNGFIGSDSVLLKGPGSKPVTAGDVANAFATVTNRLADRSLPPTPDVTPTK